MFKSVRIFISISDIVDISILQLVILDLNTILEKDRKDFFIYFFYKTV